MADLPHGIRRAFRLALGRPPIEQEVDAEIDFHLEMRAAELVERGMAPEAALAEARRRFGDTHEWGMAMSEVDRERVARSERAEWLSDLRQDLHFGARSALRSPLFTLLAVVTLALGIGANAAVFGVVKSVLLDALPYADADRLVRVYGRFLDGSNDRGPLSAGTVTDIAARQRSFVGTAAFATLPRESILEGDEPRVVQVEWAEPKLFRVLGVKAALGRTLRDDDAVGDTAFTVMVTYAAWQQLLGGDPGVVGGTIDINGITRTVAGVLPRGFVGPGGDADFYYPLDVRLLLRDPISARGSGWLGVVGRLKPGVTVDGARRDVAAIGADLAREYPRDNGSITLSTVPLRDSMVGDTRTPLLVLMASAGLVLLITCANLAGALLSRTISRRKEFAVRMALGAGRGRLVRQLLTESALLAIAGGVAGIALAEGGLAMLRRLASRALPSYAELSLDPGALLFTFVLALCTGIAFGLVPALSARRSNTQATLRDESRSATESRPSRRLRGVLVAAQIALCVSLLAGAGLLIRSLAALTSASLGFNAGGVLSVNVQLPADRYRSLEEQENFFEQLEERLRGLPGVTGVADATALPTAVMQRNGIRVIGAPPPPDNVLPFALYAGVSDDYFRTLGIPLRSGRTFGPQDGPDGPPTIIISESMARRFWPKGDALGAQMRMGPDPNSTPLTVVGIVGDVRNDPTRPDAEPITYAPARQDVRQSRFLLVRTSGDPLALVRPFRGVLTALDPSVPMRDAMALSAFLSDGLTGRRRPVVLMSAFGALALLLASVGVYAMFAAMAAAREREFGIRVALGSTRREIAALVLRQGAVWMLAGLVGGAAGVVVVARLVSGLLYGVRPLDPVALGITLLTVVACALVALLVPVRRATRVDPITTLR
ncbi:MAG TPA: ABC transporter permease [Gemmatimonadaceae bacterium]|nr:ABC transporter permease [Gemmatimonadaceae bacterium]